VSRLRLDRITHRFAASPVIDGLDLTVNAGEIVCLLGPSGCGKTTLLRLIAGLETLQQGSIQFADRTLALALGLGQGGLQLPPEQRGVGMMFQDYALFPHLSVADNLYFGLNRADQRRRDWVRRALADMGLAAMAGRFPHTLSGGQQQRVALLRALAPAPGVMLLDEPFSGLDEYLRQQVREDTLAMLRQSPAATVIVTHDPEEAMYLADRIAVLHKGRLAQVATPEELFRRPVSPFVARLFGPVNEFHTRPENGVLPTPLGNIPCPEGLVEGQQALVMVRAHDVHIQDPASTGGALAGTCAEVVSVRPLGGHSRVILHCNPRGADGQTRPVELRIRWNEAPGEGAQVRLSVPSGRAFVYGVD